MCECIISFASLQVENKKELLATLKGGVKGTGVASAQSTPQTGSTVKTGNVMSMSVSLGGQAVPFGKAGEMRSTKKTTKKKRQPKNNAQNYDDEGVGLP